VRFQSAAGAVSESPEKVLECSTGIIALLHVLCFECSAWLTAAVTVFVDRSKLVPMCIERTMKSTRCCGALMVECSSRWRPHQPATGCTELPNLMTNPCKCAFAACGQAKGTCQEHEMWHSAHSDPANMASTSWVASNAIATLIVAPPRWFLTLLHRAGCGTVSALHSMQRWAISLLKAV